MIVRWATTRWATTRWAIGAHLTSEAARVGKRTYANESGEGIPRLVGNVRTAVTVNVRVRCGEVRRLQRLEHRSSSIALGEPDMPIRLYLSIRNAFEGAHFSWQVASLSS